MTDATLPPAGRSAERDFRIGRVLGRTSSVFSRNFPSFFMLSCYCSNGSTRIRSEPCQLTGLGLSLGVVLSQAIVLYGAFQDMRGRPVDLIRSLRVGLHRFLPILGVAISVTLFAALGLMLFVVPG